MATRLVALATDGGRPRKINTGRLISDPPPAMVLKNPAMAPTTSTRRMCRRSMNSKIGNIHFDSTDWSFNNDQFSLTYDVQK
jgi:hypothetical protein